jgi:hypothetical protein
MEHYLIKINTIDKDLSEFLNDSKIMSLSEFIKGKLDNKVYVRSYFRRRPVKK